MILRPSHLDNTFWSYWLLVCLSFSLSHTLASLCDLVFSRNWWTHFPKCLSAEMAGSRVDLWGREVPVWWQSRRQVVFFSTGWNYVYSRSLEKSHGKLLPERKRREACLWQELIPRRCWYASRSSVSWQWTRQLSLSMQLFPCPSVVDPLETSS